MKARANNLILIDCWQHLHHPMELLAKQKIQNFLARIEGKKDWKIYVWSSDLPLDSKIYNQLTKGDFDVAFEFQDPLLIYDTWYLDHDVRYWFCGFHTNACLFYNTIGIEKYMQIANKIKSQFWILSDATVAPNDRQPCTPDNIPWYIPSDTDLDNAIIMNYRNHVIRTNSIRSDDVVI